MIDGNTGENLRNIFWLLLFAVSLPSMPVAGQTAAVGEATSSKTPALKSDQKPKATSSATAKPTATATANTRPGAKASGKSNARPSLDAKTIQQKQIILRELKSAFDRQDDLAVRVLVKLFAAYPMSQKEWSFVRKAIHKRPRAGFDLIFKWDQLRPEASDKNSRETRLNTLIAQADAAMLKDNFDKAFRYFQLLAKFLKAEINRGQRENYFLYWSSVHSMARALYGAGRYKEALQVYSWITKDYYQYRQVLFEKMWSAFRAGRMDIAMGAIASQQSSYFSDYMEPESYLIQVYLLKKLCRDDELKRVRDLIRLQRRRLAPKTGTYSFEEWVKSDVEMSLLYRLSQVSLKENDTYLSRKKLEQGKILTALRKRFEKDKQRLFKQMDMVLGYSGLSVGMDRTRVNTEVVPDRAAMLRSNREIWPADSAEDWLDEFGGHIYIGESACPEKTKL